MTSFKLHIVFSNTIHLLIISVLYIRRISSAETAGYVFVIIGNRKEYIRIHSNICFDDLINCMNLTGIVYKYIIIIVYIVL